MDPYINDSCYSYHFSDTPQHLSDGPLVRDRSASDAATYRVAELHEFSTMDRYLGDHHRPLYRPRSMDDYAVMRPIQPRPLQYLASIPDAYTVPQRLSSPSDSGPASSYISSNWSDGHRTPWSSPGPTYSPEIAYLEDLPYEHESRHIFDHSKRHISGPCVALHDVQNYADAQPEKDAFDDEQGVYYPSYAQEGYEPMQPNGEHPNGLDLNGSDTVSATEIYSDSPKVRRRRTQTSRVSTSPVLPSKVAKSRPCTKRSGSYQPGRTGDKSKANGHFTTARAFPCPFAVYGCESTFGSKNEWKRHVNTQHMRLGYWRCTQCDQSERKPNDFNRKDLFIQHVRRMHPPTKAKAGNATKCPSPRSAKNDPEELELNNLANRCFRRIRSSPEQSSCVLCEVKFNGTGTWDERLEHIGRHLENSKKESDEPTKPEDWQKDEDLERWLSREEIIIADGNGFVLTDGKA